MLTKYPIFKSLLLAGFLLPLSTTSAKTPKLSIKEISSPPARIIRTCCSFGSDLSMGGIPFAKRTDITSVADLGPHQYMGNKEEANGNIYCNRGGFIDLGHVRDCADWTAYLSVLILEYVEDGGQLFLNLGMEGGQKTLTIDIPKGMNQNDVFILAGNIAYDLALWHEIATWFGASFIPLVPEWYSSFSPEDLYSNLLGVNLAIEALKSDMEYDDAMTQYLNNALDTLGAVESLEETYIAMENVESVWWTRKKKLPSKQVLLKRYFDTDLALMPWLIPNDEFHYEPYQLKKPDATNADLYKLEIKLNKKFPVKEIFYSKENRIITQKDFSHFQQFIKQDIIVLEQKVAFREERRKRRKQQ